MQVTLRPLNPKIEGEGRVDGRGEKEKKMPKNNVLLARKDVFRIPQVQFKDGRSKKCQYCEEWREGVSRLNEIQILQEGGDSKEKDVPKKGKSF